jgi:hypothetical protein
MTKTLHVRKMAKKDSQKKKKKMAKKASTFSSGN